MNRRYFGTDGIRGRVGEHPMTPEFVLKLGWAAGRALSAERQGLVLIGKDTRLSGYVFESALQAGLASAGMDVRLLGPVPTPAVAYLTRTQSAVAGVVISASHNPYYDNGIKFFSGSGKKLSDEMEASIEALLDQQFEMGEAVTNLSEFVLSAWHGAEAVDAPLVWVGAASKFRETPQSAPDTCRWSSFDEQFTTGSTRNHETRMSQWTVAFWFRRRYFVCAPRYARLAVGLHRAQQATGARTGA